MPRFKKTASTLLWRKLHLRTLQKSMIERPRKNTELTWGNFGIQALSPVSVTQEHIDRVDMILRTMMRRTDANADTHFFLNFWFPVTQKSQGQRMGGGIGKFSHTVAPIRSGEIFCQIRCDNPMAVVHAFRCLKSKFPMQTRLIHKEYKGEIIKRFAPNKNQLIQGWKMRLKQPKASSK